MKTICATQNEGQVIFSEGCLSEDCVGKMGSNDLI
jgi:hypothetical protein